MAKRAIIALTVLIIIQYVEPRRKQSTEQAIILIILVTLIKPIFVAQYVLFVSLLNIYIRGRNICRQDIHMVRYLQTVMQQDLISHRKSIGRHLLKERIHSSIENNIPPAKNLKLLG